MNKIANIARVAMWVMIGVILLSFFFTGPWIRIVWVVAAVVCLICVLIVAASKNKRGTP